MKIGIFSDVHSNLDALHAILSYYGEEACDKYLCLGDIVGYGPRPDECCSVVREFAETTVLGNHDAAVCKRMNYSYYYDAARNVLDYHARILSEENMLWLKSLPYTKHYEDFDFMISHGSPLNPEDFNYVFSPEQARQHLPFYDKLPNITFIGHSHLTKSYELSRFDVVDITNNELTFRPDRKYIVTVGSVGQPRDYDNRACCTVFDTEARTLHYERRRYDVLNTLKQIFESDISYNFGKRLFLGI